MNDVGGTIIYFKLTSFLCPQTQKTARMEVDEDTAERPERESARSDDTHIRQSSYHVCDEGNLSLKIIYLEMLLSTVSYLKQWFTLSYSQSRKKDN